MELERDRTAGLLVANEALSQPELQPHDFYILPTSGKSRKALRAFYLFDEYSDGRRARHRKSPYNWFIFARNSALLRAFSRRLTKTSIASTGESGLITRRRTQMRERSSLASSSSSLRVPER